MIYIIYKMLELLKKTLSYLKDVTLKMSSECFFKKHNRLIF